MIENNSIQDVGIDTLIAANPTEAQLAATITDSVNAMLPEEKLKLEKEMLQTGIEKQNRDSHWVDGLGQEIGSIPPTAYHRWNQLLPGCWKDRDFKNEFLYDNPACCLNGYRPKSKTLFFDMGKSTQTPPSGAAAYRLLKAKAGLPDGMAPLPKISV